MSEVREERLPSGVWFIRQPRRPFPAREDDEQEMFVRWCWENGIWVHSVPNHLVRDKRTGAAEKKKGLSKGATDLIVATRSPLPLAPYPLVIEMKTTGSTHSAVEPDQWKWLEYWASQGAFAAVCCGRECAIRACELVGLLGKRAEPAPAGDSPPRA